MRWRAWYRAGRIKSFIPASIISQRRRAPWRAAFVLHDARDQGSVRGHERPPWLDVEREVREALVGQKRARVAHEIAGNGERQASRVVDAEAAPRVDELEAPAVPSAHPAHDAKQLAGRREVRLSSTVSCEPTCTEKPTRSACEALSTASSATPTSSRATPNFASSCPVVMWACVPTHPPAPPGSRGSRRGPARRSRPRAPRHAVHLFDALDCALRRCLGLGATAAVELDVRFATPLKTTRAGCHPARERQLELAAAARRRRPHRGRDGARPRTGAVRLDGVGDEVGCPSNDASRSRAPASTAPTS